MSGRLVKTLSPNTMIFLLWQNGAKISHNIANYDKSGITFIRMALAHVKAIKESTNTIKSPNFNPSPWRIFFGSY